MSQAAFGLSLPAKDKPSYGVANDMQGNVVLLALDEVKAGSMPEAQKKAMVQGITQNNAQIVFEALMSNLRKAAKLKSVMHWNSSNNRGSSQKIAKSCIYQRPLSRPFPFLIFAICLPFCTSLS